MRIPFRFTVVGAGGIGCAVGYVLRRAGATVTFVEADLDKVRWGRANGVRVGRRPAQAADFCTFDEWRPEPDAVVLLCTKCYDNAAVLERLPSSAVFLPIQNGFDPDLAARDHALEGVASFVSECEPGRCHTHITRRGRLHLGFRGAERARNGEQELLFALTKLLRRHAPFRVVAVPEILPYKYTKLMYNAAISPLAAAAGLDNGQLLSVHAARRLFFELLRENYAILKHAAVPLGKVGPFHPDTVNRILRSRLAADSLVWLFYPTLRGSYCSMSGDLPRGRTEIDYYNRHLLDLAGDHPAPLNRRVYQVVKRMERDRIPPGPHALGELTRD